MKRSPIARKTGLAKKRAKARIVRDRAPKPKAEAILYPDGIGGREICNQKCAAGKREYAIRTSIMWHRQHGICALCGRGMNQPTFDHANGRGAGKRDDRVWDSKGNPMNAALCLWCNTAVKGSKRIAYPYQTSVTRSEWEARK